MNLANYDWKKQASQVAQDTDVEKAFLDQAYSFISNKSKPLLANPHRLGFEIISKNDSNTRMVGIFAFRVNEDLLYAPVFFLNGEIKGTDLLYRHSTKTFVPNNEEWIKYLLDKNITQLGNSIDRTESNKFNPNVRLDRIQAPLQQKTASNADLLEDMSAPKELVDILTPFLQEDADVSHLDKLASWMGESYEFANAFVNNINIDEYEKLASAVSSPAPSKSGDGDLLFFNDIRPDQDQIKTKEDQFYRKGFYLVDHRTDETKSLIYDDIRREVHRIEDSGKYDVMTEDGCFRECFTAKLAADRFNDYAGDGGNFSDSPGAAYGGHWNGYARSEVRLVVVDLKSKASKDVNATRKEVFGKWLELPERAILEIGEDKVTCGKGYRVYDKEKGTLSEPFYVHDVENLEDNIQVITILESGYQSPKKLKHNPDYKRSHYDKGIIGKHCVFVEVAVKEKKDRDGEVCNSSSDMNKHPAVYFDTDLSLGSEDGINDWIYNAGVKTATVRFAHNEYQIELSHRNKTPWLKEKIALVKLAQDLSINADSAVEILESAQKEREVRFLIEFQKNSYATQLSQDPEFLSHTDSELGMQMEIPQKVALRTETQSPFLPPGRFGDHYDQRQGHGPVNFNGDGLSKDVVMKSSPDELAQLGQSLNIPHIFEHGVVGSLAQTFDSAAMIDKYTPKLEAGLDSLGRILFLFYWKPADFEHAYGSDDMTNLEQKLLSNFKSFGEITLDLLKKSKNREQGSNSFVL